jgi:hypothetical protein
LIRSKKFLRGSRSIFLWIFYSDYLKNLSSIAYGLAPLPLALCTWYNYPNPLVKILLPKTNYTPEERSEVIRQAYRGLFELVAPMLFDKYVDFIDIYAEIRKDEREALYKNLSEKEDTAMPAKYIRNKGMEAGIQQGIQQGLLEGISALLEIKFGKKGLQLLPEICKIDDVNRLRQIADVIKNSMEIHEVIKLI